jgi:16S rRNA (uracil1498-N3)-methyltransferase
MHRFYLPPEQCQTSNLVLSESDAHHGLHVLRLRPDERVAVLDGEGHEFHCKVGAMDRQGMSLAVLQKSFIPPLPHQLTLVQAIPRGKTMDSIVQKATELGVQRIVPLLSERIAVHVDGEDAIHKVGKWQTTAIEAIKQCGSAWLPRVETPMTPKNFLARGEKFDLAVIASLQADSRHPRHYFESYRAERGALPGSICVWIGPEGDFTPAEVGAAKSAGALPISLGQLILRSDTAAIYALSVLNYELQAETR